jgi:selenide,water dikinase
MSKVDPNTIRLTTTVQKGGCAAKLPATQLRAVLSQLKMKGAPELLIGTATMDDACVWNLGGSRRLIQTLDFFTPIVDDAHDFGAIAAANAISDVYAMGGEPKIVLGILAFPSLTLPIEILEPLFAGALEVIHEAGAVLAGGHSIDDETLKLGFSVTGFVEDGQVWSNQGAQPGDHLILTKALGIGTITSALKRGEVSPESLQAAILSMRQLNRAPELLKGEMIHAATDVTGFGLAGHALQMARASHVQMHFDLGRLPSLPGARELLAAGVLNRAHRTNWEYVQSEVQIEGSEVDRWLAVDPQTSGGLLLSVAAADSPRILEKLRGRFHMAQVIGEVSVGLDLKPRCVFINKI